MIMWIASLAMYDDISSELRSANDALWEVIAERLVRHGLEGVPRRLERTVQPPDVWLDERLLFAQACGAPFASRLKGHLRLVGTPDYALPGCALGHHTSFVLVPARSIHHALRELRGTRVAINDPESMTGSLLLEDAIASLGEPLPFFGQTEISGSHKRSVELVASASADVAAIDCVSYAHIARAYPDLVAETRVIGRTSAAPCLPFVVPFARGEAAAKLVALALREAILDPRTEDARRALHLTQIRAVSLQVYEHALQHRSAAGLPPIGNEDAVANGQRITGC